VGECRLIRRGEGFRAKQGLIFLPPGVPYQPCSPVDEPARAVLSCADQNEQESVVLLDDSPAG
jgi:hypothetical protein